MTTEQIVSLNLGLGMDAKTTIMLDAAIEWLKENTTIDTTDVENFPACAKLFLIKYTEIYSLQSGVASESIEGLSQSFSSGNQSAMVWDIANELLGAYLKSRVRFVAAQRKWQ